MDNIHVTQSPAKQRDSGYMNSSNNMNSFNIKSLDTAEKGATSGQASGSGLNLSVPVIIFLGILSVIGIFVIIAALISSIHRVHEGNVALYYRNGALLPDHSGPGIHTCTPFVTTVLQVQKLSTIFVIDQILVQITVRPETKILDPMKCTTKDGVSNVFKNVQVKLRSLHNKTQLTL